MVIHDALESSIRSSLPISEEHVEKCPSVSETYRDWVVMIPLPLFSQRRQTLRYNDGLNSNNIICSHWSRPNITVYEYVFSWSTTNRIQHSNELTNCVMDNCLGNDLSVIDESEGMSFIKLINLIEYWTFSVLLVSFSNLSSIVMLLNQTNLWNDIVLSLCLFAFNVASTTQAFSHKQHDINIHQYRCLAFLFLGLSIFGLSISGAFEVLPQSFARIEGSPWLSMMWRHEQRNKFCQSNSHFDGATMQ